MKLIIARNASGNIDFPTSLADRQRYQALTVGGICVYGKTTWDTLPPAARRNRTSVILRQNLTDTYGAAAQVDGGSSFHALLGNVMGVARWVNSADVWICGGKKIYDRVLALYFDKVSHIYLSTFHTDHAGSLRVDIPGYDGLPEASCWDRICSQSFTDHTFTILRKKS